VQDIEDLKTDNTIFKSKWKKKQKKTIYIYLFLKIPVISAKKFSPSQLQLSAGMHTSISLTK